MYPFLRNCLFCLDPENSHTLALQSLQLIYRCKLSKLLTKPISNPITVMGLHFENRVGLAAGLDKNADYVDALAALGFGFIEIGTVTPKPQPGNERPRLFRLAKQKAIINRMGFNSKGMEYVANRLEKIRYKGILGINLGKNKDTPIEKAAADYLLGFQHLWPFASYVTINISSPNTEGLRNLQQGHLLEELLQVLKEAQSKIQLTQKKYVPLVVKISPDLNHDAIQELARILLLTKIDGLIATNTTIQRNNVDSPFAKETGGLSGAPLCTQSTEVIREFHKKLKNKIPIIASGGVMNEHSAQEKLNAGADLLQIYSGFIYEGPALISRLAVLS